jgi:hypothetical protein
MAAANEKIKKVCLLCRGSLRGLNCCFQIQNVVLDQLEHIEVTVKVRKEKSDGAAIGKELKSQSFAAS